MGGGVETAETYYNANCLNLSDDMNREFGVSPGKQEPSNVFETTPTKELGPIMYVTDPDGTIHTTFKSTGAEVFLEGKNVFEREHFFQMISDHAQKVLAEGEQVLSNSADQVLIVRDDYVGGDKPLAYIRTR